MERLGWSIHKCGRPAVYQFGDKHLCSQHAGIYLCQKVEAGKLTIDD